MPFKGAPGGDDNQNIWWNPNNPDIMLLVADQGAVVTLNGGQTWSSWYTQPTAALYPRDDGQRVPVPRLRRPAGQRIGLHREPGQRWPDHVSRLASRGRRGIRIRRPGSAQSRSRLRRQGDAVRPADRPGVRCRACPDRTRPWRPPQRARPAYRTVRTQPVVFSTVDPRVLFYAQQRAVEDARRRAELDADQPRPDPRDVGGAEERRHLRVARPDDASAARSARR